MFLLQHSSLDILNSLKSCTILQVDQWIQGNHSRSVTPLGIIRGKKKKGERRRERRGVQGFVSFFEERYHRNPRTMITHRFAFVSDVLRVSGSWNEGSLSSKSFYIIERESRANDARDGIWNLSAWNPRDVLVEQWGRNYLPWID